MSDACQVRRRITVHCPISGDTLRAVAAGDSAAMERDPTVAPLLAFITSCPELGDFGTYEGVCEITLGLEVFKPKSGAAPTVGEIGQRTYLPMAMLSTYLAPATPAARADAILGELARRHPWELPVIEVADVTLYLP